MTKFIFIRHGQSVSNEKGIFTGHIDLPLTEIGKKQAENTAVFLKDYKIDAIYSSDLIRAVQTAEPTAKIHGLEIIKTPNLREIFAGEWEGKTFEYLLEKYPESYANVWRNDIGRSKADGGESVLEVYDRVTFEINEINKNHPNQTVAVFTHGTPLRVLSALWQGYTVKETNKVNFPSNASVSIIDYNDDGSYKIHLFGYDKHQGELATTFKIGKV